MFVIVLFVILSVFNPFLVTNNINNITTRCDYDILTLTVTAYAPLDNRSGICADETPNITATGTTPRRGVIAANFKRFPPGTRMYIPGYGFGVVEDTGGAMIRNPNHVDVCMDTYDEAIKWGRRKLQVKVYKNNNMEDDKVEKFVQKQYEVYKAKNALYGDSFVQSLDKWGNIAFAVRASDKLNRIQQLLSGQNFEHELTIVKDESLKDTVLDLFTYICMYDAYLNNIDVLKAMQFMAEDPYLIAAYLFCQYGENNIDLLDAKNEDDLVLFEKIVGLLKEYIQETET